MPEKMTLGDRNMRKRKDEICTQKENPFLFSEEKSFFFFLEERGRERKAISTLFVCLTRSTLMHYEIETKTAKINKWNSGVQTLLCCFFFISVVF